MSREMNLSKAAGAILWDRLWQYRATDGEDDVALAREERSQRWAMIAGFLQSTFGSIAGLLTIELGSGRGDLSALLARNGADVTLLDASRNALHQAKRRFDRLGLAAHYEHADLFETCETRQGCFDVALSSGVIEHSRGDDRTRAIEAHYRALKPGGVTIISVPNAWCPSYRLWKFYLELRGWWPYGVEIPYSKRELIWRARAAGFTPMETHCVGFLQSIGGHWWRSWVGHRPGWADRTFWLDSAFGFTLMLFASRGGVDREAQLHEHCRKECR